MFGQAMNPVIRADGSPAFAMVSTLSGAIANIILDPIFIFQWGMMGAAIATVIGQIITGILSVWYIFHMKTIKPAKKHFHLNSRICGRTLLFWLFVMGIEVFRSMRRVQTPPTVSIPSESGVTSRSSRPFTVPAKTPP